GFSPPRKKDLETFLRSVANVLTSWQISESAVLPIVDHEGLLIMIEALSFDRSALASPPITSTLTSHSITNTSVLYRAYKQYCVWPRSPIRYLPSIPVLALVTSAFEPSRVGKRSPPTSSRTRTSRCSLSEAGHHASECSHSL